MFEREIDYFNDILFSKGYNLTAQRKNIIKIFLENPQNHFSPKQLNVKIKDKGEQISAATIYRNIKILKDNNIIEEINHGEEKLYELKIFGKNSIHVHTSCIKCNKIKNYIDTKVSLKVNEQINKLEDKFYFNINKAEIFLYGFCSKCQLGGELNR